jgi:hypothetical protein
MSPVTIIHRSHRCPAWRPCNPYCDAAQAQSQTTSVAGSVALPAAPVLLATLSTRCATALTIFGHQAHQLRAQPAENLAAQVVGQPVVYVERHGTQLPVPGVRGRALRVDGCIELAQVGGRAGQQRPGPFLHSQNRSSCPAPCAPPRRVAGTTTGRRNCERSSRPKRPRNDLKPSRSTAFSKR